MAGKRGRHIALAPSHSKEGKSVFSIAVYELVAQKRSKDFEWYIRGWYNIQWHSRNLLAKSFFYN
jgi:hypothetical protein